MNAKMLLALVVLLLAGLTLWLRRQPALSAHEDGRWANMHCDASLAPLRRGGLL